MTVGAVHPCTLCKKPHRDPDNGAFCTETCQTYKDHERTFMEAAMPDVLRVRNLMKGESK